MTHHDVLIVGAGHAGAQCAIALRQGRHAGTIGLITDEAELPYERPPLSKDYLAGHKPFDRMALRPPAFWADRDIRFILDSAVEAVDPSAKQVRDRAGRSHGFGTLVWAAGGTPRRLACPGAEFAGVHTIRNRRDTDALIAALAGAQRLAIIGGGYIGLEAAAVLAKAGKAVTVIEAQDRVLARVAGPPLSRFYADEHRAHGVDLRLGAGVAALEGAGGHVSAVLLDDGTAIASDLVLVAIGIAPSVAPLIAAGAQGGNGISVDGQCRTTLPGIFAIGDCAEHANRYAGGARIRLESVQNANDQANLVARILNGGDGSYDALPWFWSNQYDLRLQTVGLSAGHDAIVVRGDPATRAFSLIYLRESRVIALDCVNMTRDYAQGRALVMAGTAADPAALADPGVPLKELAAAS